MPAAVTPKPATVSCLADGDAPRRRKFGRLHQLGERRSELDECDVGGGAACRVSRRIEARMARDAAHGNRLAGLKDLDAHIGRHAMRGREHQVARQRRAGAQIAARIDHHNDSARRIALRRRRLAADGESGRTQGEAGKGGDRRAHGLRMSLGQQRLSTLDACVRKRNSE